MSTSQWPGFRGHFIVIHLDSGHVVRIAKVGQSYSCGRTSGRLNNGMIDVGTFSASSITGSDRHPSNDPARVADVVNDGTSVALLRSGGPSIW